MKTSLLLTTLTLTLAVSASRADDTLDRVLAQNAETVLDQLRGQEFNNVGILKFELQRGGPNGPIYLNVGRIHEAGATMLENVLAFANPLEKPIGITHAASAVAIEHDPDASYRSAATRRKLFQEKYPLAWGDAKVQVDAFIVGRVTIADDLKGASLSLRYVTAKNPGKWHNLKLKKETVTVTPALLSDINQSFAVGSFVSKTRGGDDALVLNDPAFALVLGEGIKVEPSPNDTVEKKPIEPEVVQVPKVSRTEMVTTEEIAVLSDKLTIKLYYDDVEVKRSADDIFPTPQPGQKIHITLKANSKLGVVLMINGINTADYDPANRNVNDYTKWILEPGTLYTIEGYFGDGRKIPFKVLTQAEERSGQSDLGVPSYRGQIDIHIYEPIPANELPSPLISVPRMPIDKPHSLEEFKMALQEAVRQHSSYQSKSLIAPSDRSEAQELQSEAFTGKLVAKLVLRYLE